MTQEGKPIWVESLMTTQEWKDRVKKYPTSKIPEPVEEFEGEFKWRKGMGKSLSPQEIQIINERLQAVLKLVK